MLQAWIFIPATIIVFATIMTIFWQEHTRKNQKYKRSVALLAHTEVVRNLPEYKRAQKHYARILILLTITFAVFTFSVIALAARPVQVDRFEASVDNHDIMLCLDSKSLEIAPNEIISSIENKLPELRGQNIGLTIFDRSAINTIPLSNNYGAVASKLNEIRNHYQIFRNLTASATNANDKQEHSLGGDIIACANNIDKLEFNNRNKAIVLYTDRSDSRDAYMNALQASEYAKRNDVKIYSVDLGAPQTEDTNMLYEVSNISGGDYFKPELKPEDDKKTQNEMEDLFHSILRQDEEGAQDNIEYINRDTPYTYAAIATACCVIYIFLIWRLKL